MNVSQFSGSTVSCQAVTPTIRFEKLRGQSGLTLEPDLAVDLTASDLFAGRGPVLDAALRLG